MPIHSVPWNIESHRLSLFRAPGAAASAEEIWTAIADGAPEELSAKPGLGTTTAIGPFGSGQLFVQVEPSRVDCFMLGAKQSEPSPSVIGPYPDAFRKWKEDILPWIDHAPQVVRVAYGTVLTESVASKEVGYSTLATRLPYVKIDPQNSSDFLYQINRPRISTTIKDLTVNRLSKWAVQRIIVTSASTTGVNGFRLADTPISDMYQCRLELDISSAIERAEALPSDLMSKLLEELFAIAEELIEKGDVL